MALYSISPLQPIDLYCERLGPAFWAEPVNAVSNLAFVLAALWAWAEARKHPPVPVVLNLLIALGGAIGVGSFLFHTFANTWSEWADVVPIWSFVALYVLTAIHMVGGVAPGRVLRIGAAVGAVLVVVFLATGSQPAAPSPPVLNGSLQYAPALIALAVFAGITWRRRHPMAPWAGAAALSFLVSLIFRTIDLGVCASLPVGTHFLWHILNGLMVALLLQALVRNRL
ncbi:ceramidase domain-containing protein [Shimia sp.]|uniref:ceramidase domain-containing protein n=1 Tax=Shimia sp. TaxID=1954381 RepID=UPI00356B3381